MLRGHKEGTCQHLTTAFSWDEHGVLDQAKDLGKPYTEFYLVAYAMPLMHAHVSLASAMQESDKKPDEERKAQRRDEWDLALSAAHAVILMAFVRKTTCSHSASIRKSKLAREIGLKCGARRSRDRTVSG